MFDDAVRIAGSTGAEIVILHIRMTWTSHPDELRLPADPSIYEYAERIELEKLRDRVKRANASIATRLVVKSAPDPGGEISRDGESGEHRPRRHVDARAPSRRAPPRRLDHARGDHEDDRAAAGHPLRNPDTSRSMQRIVVPVHAKQHSHAALDLAAAIAARQGGELHLLTVCADGGRKRRQVPR